MTLFSIMDAERASRVFRNLSVWHGHASGARVADADAKEGGLSGLRRGRTGWCPRLWKKVLAVADMALRSVAEQAADSGRPADGWGFPNDMVLYDCEYGWVAIWLESIVRLYE